MLNRHEMITNASDCHWTYGLQEAVLTGGLKQYVSKYGSKIWRADVEF
jgi:hypothetical protein